MWYFCYDQPLAELFDYFHRNPELSSMEIKTATQLSEELRAAGFEVTEGLGRAKSMIKAGLWEQFGKPDYALAFHVSSGVPTVPVHTKVLIQLYLVPK